MTTLYVLRNKENGKLYVGQTSQSIEKRILNHRYASTKFGTALRKHGPEGFVRFEFIVPSELADSFEQQMIARLDSIRRGYNLTEGGHVFKMAKESAEKIRESHLGQRNAFWGKHHSAETRERIGEALKERYRQHPHHLKGGRVGPEMRARISATLKRIGHGKNPKSPETRQKISSALRGRPGRPWTEEQRERHHATIVARRSA